MSESNQKQKENPNISKWLKSLNEHEKKSFFKFIKDYNIFLEQLESNEKDSREPLSESYKLLMENSWKNWHDRIVKCLDEKSLEDKNLKNDSTQNEPEEKEECSTQQVVKNENNSNKRTNSISHVTTLWESLKEFITQAAVDDHHIDENMKTQ